MTATEALAQQGTPLSAALATGLNSIDENAVVTFTRYLRLVLPFDGYLFWVKADVISPSSKFNAAVLNGVPFNQAALVTEAAGTFSARGSLHYTTTTNQGEAATSSVNRVIFTSLDSTQDLNAIRPGELLIGEFQGLKFAFSERRGFYDQAKLQHYVGDAVYPDMMPQLVDDPATFNAMDVVVSNSLPIWLSMNEYAGVSYLPFSNTAIPLYPSFVVPDDVRPPYIAVHIVPESTEALASAATLGPTLSHSQLTMERVRLTILGVRNADAQTFVDFVNQFSLNTNLIGIMNMPVLRDEKRTQSELGAIGMRKTIEYEVNYYQTAARDLARQLILRAIPSYISND